MIIPQDHESFDRYWRQNETALIGSFASGQHSFIPNLLPEKAVSIPSVKVYGILSGRIGNKKLYQALDPANTIDSPLKNAKTSDWIKTTNMVGINIRTLGNFWNVIKYLLTVPASQPSVHFLPIWEPGVVDSLYGMASWNINPEFFSRELAGIQPELHTVEKQLKVVVNLIHALGKVAGMDVIPHTDRYAEIVLANPHYFEWLHRKDTQIIDHRANLHVAVQEHIFQFLQDYGSADPRIAVPATTGQFFAQSFREEDRLRVLFGRKEDQNGRNQRRAELVDHLFSEGLEPVPATMAPPYRGLTVDTETKVKADSKGRVWRDYKITRPQEMSRVFGPLTRYKLYERLDDNQDWAIDFNRPRKEVWDYVCHRYAQVQSEYNFDFMRGDMSHVQMRPEGVPHQVDAYYDIHRAVRKHIRRQKPYFGYFAESFLTAAGFMAYGDEIDHLEMSDADSALGDLQSIVVGSPRFLQNFRWYLDILHTRQFAPNFTVMTGDKDDPRFDEFYMGGNEARLFIALLLTDMPSYMGLGFETRDIHEEPAPNEHYTKLYVFRIGEGPKATKGPYVWGKNGALFYRLTRIRLFAEHLLPGIEGKKARWLLPPDATGVKKIIAWTLEDQPGYLFVVNLDIVEEARNIKIPAIPGLKENHRLHLQFSSLSDKFHLPPRLPFNGKNYQIDRLLPGEARAYEVK